MEKRKVTISITQMNVFSIGLLVGAILVFFVPFCLLWPEWYIHVPTGASTGKFPLVLLASVVIGVLAHEGLHGLTWALLNKGGFRHVNFGVMWKYVTPYCHYSEPMSRGRYIAGALMPCAVLGVVPAVGAWFNGNVWWLFFGIFFFAAAAGDIWMTWLMLKEPKDALFLDHPSEAGFYVMEKGPEEEK
ncbi:MAG: DUF3267 domain-containing protein [Bacteroidales bacterium]|nr:DUF3267 domain-containing protein [Bacteroidales bacterium]